MYKIVESGIYGNELTDKYKERQIKSPQSVCLGIYSNAPKMVVNKSHYLRRRFNVVIINRVQNEWTVSQKIRAQLKICDFGLKWCPNEPAFDDHT